MGHEKLISEKTPTLQANKTPFDYDNQREKIPCSISKLSWTLASILLILTVLLIILFLYPTSEIIIREEPLDINLIPPRSEDPATGENNPGNAVNPWDFEFLINPINLCATINPPNSVEYQNNPEVKVLILVPSAVDHFGKRKAIRNTWGSIAERPLAPTRLGFVLGSTTNKTLEDQIRQESSQFRDIIQIDFGDNYQQSTTKSILMLKWVAKMCPHAEYFLKTEDDTFVNMWKIANILNQEPYISEDRFIAGHVVNITPILNMPQTAFHQNIDDNLMDNFPPYASNSYVMSIPTAIDLFGATKEVEPFFPEDDAFLTGLCAKHLDVPLIHEPSFIVDDPPMPLTWNIYSALSTAHSASPDALELVWDDMKKSITNRVHYFETAINATGTLRRKKNA